MKKGSLIFITSLLILLGCRGKSKDADSPSVTPESVRIEITAASPVPSAATQDTPWPYPSNENLFVPEVTELPTPEPTTVPTSTPATERYAVAEGIETVAWLSDTHHYTY